MVGETDPRAEATAEKAYADASATVSTRKVAQAIDADAHPSVDEGEIAQAVAAPAARRERVLKTKKTSAAKRKAKPARKVGTKLDAALASPKIQKTTSKRPLSTLKDKIMDTANTTEFTDTVKNAAADVQTRAKAAMQKLQAYAGEVTDMNKGNVEALVESGKIFGAGLQDMARGEFEAAKDAFATATADLKALAAVKSPTELFKLQGEIARRNFDAAVARYSKTAEASLKLANDAFAPISNRMSLAAEKVSQAA